MSTPNPQRGQNAAVLLGRTYIFAAFGGRWPGVAYLILALSGTLALWVPFAPGCRGPVGTFHLLVQKLLGSQPPHPRL
jgi:hypothetical protein